MVTIRSQSFESETPGGLYRNAATNGNLLALNTIVDITNNPGEATVDAVNVSGTLLGFDATWQNTRSNVGLSDGDLVGVTNFIGEVGSFTDGVQGYLISDPDGKYILTFDTVDISNFANVSVSLDYFLSDTAWELSDVVTINVVTDIGSFAILDSTGLDIDNLNVEGTFIRGTQAIPDTATTAQLVVTLDSNFSDENLYIDNILFAGDSISNDGSGDDGSSDGSGDDGSGDDGSGDDGSGGDGSGDGGSGDDSSSDGSGDDGSGSDGSGGDGSSGDGSGDGNGDDGSGDDGSGDGGSGDGGSGDDGNGDDGSGDDGSGDGGSGDDGSGDDGSGDGSSGGDDGSGDDGSGDSGSGDDGSGDGGSGDDGSGDDGSGDDGSGDDGSGDDGSSDGSGDDGSGSDGSGGDGSGSENVIAEILDLTGMDGNITANVSLMREAAFDNLLQFYITDANGAVGGINPGEAGYEDAVRHNLLTMPQLFVENRMTKETTITLEGGFYYAPALLIDGDLHNLATIGDAAMGMTMIKREGDVWFFEDKIDADFNDLEFAINSIATTPITS